jgi:hypothetical protein
MITIDKNSNFERKTTRDGKPLYFCRCDGDGSWLIKLETHRGVFSRTPETPAKITLDEAQHYNIASGPYALVSVAINDENRVAHILDNDPMGYEALWQRFVKSSPFGFRFQRAELGVILNRLVRIGRVEVVTGFDGVFFQRGVAPESKALNSALADGWKALRGDSNDAEHDALVSIIEALTGEEV